MRQLTGEMVKSFEQTNTLDQKKKEIIFMKIQQQKQGLFLFIN